MADKASTGAWEQIRETVAEVEKLVVQKEYNQAMIKAREALELMVYCLAEPMNIDGDSLSDVIDELYRKRVISTSTAEHYHKIRLIGNKAAHNQDNSAYNANTAYHLLTQEVYAFANTYKNRNRASQKKAKSAESEQKPARKKFKPAGAQLLFLFMIPILIIIILIGLIKTLSGKKEEQVIETQPAAIIEETTVPETTAIKAPAPTEAVKETRIYVVTSSDGLNVRSAPSTSSDKITVLDPDEEVAYLEDVDESWAAILIDGQEYYVAKQWITPQ